MDPAPRSIPNILILRRHDAILGNTLWMAFFSLVVAVGTKWASHGVTPGPDTPAFEMEAFNTWIPIGGVVVSCISAFIAAWRFAWIKKVLTRGTTVKAMVEDLERQDTNMRKDSQGRNITTYIYYATLRYEMHGRDRKVRLKLPNSGTSYSLMKGRETDIMVLDEAPEKPLICSVYFQK